MVNITESQLSVGRDRLREAAVLGIVGDATRLPIADQSIDRVISVEAAFHFRSRRAFFDECFRVLKPGGAAGRHYPDAGLRAAPKSGHDG